MTLLLLLAFGIGPGAGHRRISDYESSVCHRQSAVPWNAAAGDIEQMQRERSLENPRPLPGTLPRPGGFRGPATGTWLDSVIRDDFPCNDDTSGGGRHDGPDLDVGPDGGFVVSWYEFRDGDADVWFQRFDSAGSPLGVNQRLNTDITLGWQGDPSSAVGPDGSFMFAWEDRRDIGNSDVFGQRLDSAGNRLGDNFRISDSAAGGDQDISGCHTGPDGTTLVAWDDRRNGLTGDIYAQFLNPDGSPRDTNFRVNDDPIGVANQYEPEVGCDSIGRFAMAWMDGRGNNAYDWNVFCQRFGSNGSRIGTNIQVTTDDSIQWSPHIGVGAGGGFVVSWDDHRRGQWDVNARLFNSQGQPVGPDFRANDDPGSADQFASDAAVNGYGEFVVVWADQRNGNEDIYGQRYNADGSPAGVNFRIDDAPGGSNQGAPTIAALPEGGYRAAWVDRRGGGGDIYLRRLGRDGTPVGPAVRVNDDTAGSQQRVSSLGTARDGRTYVAWEDERNGSTDIYGCLLDPAGVPVGANRRLNDDGAAGPGQYYAAVGAGTGRFLAAWTDERNGLDIYGQYLDGNGQPLGANFRVNSDGGSAYQWYPYCALDSLNRAIVIWMDTRPGPFQIFGRQYDSSGSPLAPEFAVQDSNAYGYYGSVATGPDGRFVATWMDYRDGESNVYCQMFRPDGSRIGTNFRVNTDGTDHFHGYPACAIDRQGRFVVAWEDTRTEYDVFLQWFDSTGARLGENERVTDGPPDMVAYSPTCAFEPGGRLAVMFNDEREFPGNPQIWCQRFRPDRTRIGLNRKVNRPNAFPANSHWSVGQSIGATAEALVFAWTDNRRHRGWDIFAKLTDWELVGAAEAGRALFRGALLPGLVRRGAVHRLGPDESASVYDATGRRWCRQTGPGELRFPLRAGAYFVVTGKGPGAVRKVVVE